MNEFEKYELDFIKNFIRERHYRGDFGRKTLRCLWTAYCYHQDLNPDTAPYDKTIYELWLLTDKEDTWDWCDFTSFDFYMGVYLS